MKNNTSKKIGAKLVDPNGRTLGRVASETAILLMGKTKSSYERHVYSGFPVKVINASKIRITAKKLEGIYHARYSGYRGGLRILKGVETAGKKGLKELVKLAVYRMLPGNKLRREMMKNLEVED